MFGTSRRVGVVSKRVALAFRSSRQFGQRQGAASGGGARRRRALLRLDRSTTPRRRLPGQELTLAWCQLLVGLRLDLPQFSAAPRWLEFGGVDEGSALVQCGILFFWMGASPVTDCAVVLGCIRDQRLRGAAEMLRGAAAGGVGGGCGLGKGVVCASAELGCWWHSGAREEANLHVHNLGASV